MGIFQWKNLYNSSKALLGGVCLNRSASLGLQSVFATASALCFGETHILETLNCTSSTGQAAKLLNCAQKIALMFLTPAIAPTAKIMCTQSIMVLWMKTVEKISTENQLCCCEMGLVKLLLSSGDLVFILYILLHLTYI